MKRSHTSILLKTHIHICEMHSFCKIAKLLNWLPEILKFLRKYWNFSGNTEISPEIPKFLRKYRKFPGNTELTSRNTGRPSGYSENILTLLHSQSFLFILIRLECFINQCTNPNSPSNGSVSRERSRAYQMWKQLRRAKRIPATRETGTASTREMRR